ncbi:MAG: hypothetical protein BGO54_04855 [Sphingobacteriales bacterium 46-32]|nr:MAG: hypothetical protein BGO54_04855 [Sphingobacteriales bacterium 46-32]
MANVSNHFSPVIRLINSARGKAQFNTAQIPDSVLFKKINQNSGSIVTGQGDAVKLGELGFF